MAYRTFGQRSGGFSAKLYDVVAQPRLNGQWSVQFTANGKTEKSLVGLSSELLGQLFTGGITTVAQLEFAELLAGLRPDEVPVVDAYGVLWAKPELVAGIINGTHKTSKLVNPKDADALKAVYEATERFTEEEKSNPPESWKKTARGIKIRVLPYGCSIDNLIDSQMVEFDLSRRGERVNA